MMFIAFRILLLSGWIIFLSSAVEGRCRYKLKPTTVHLGNATLAVCTDLKNVKEDEYILQQTDAGNLTSDSHGIYLVECSQINNLLTYLEICTHKCFCYVNATDFDDLVVTRCDCPGKSNSFTEQVVSTIVEMGQWTDALVFDDLNSSGANIGGVLERHFSCTFDIDSTEVLPANLMGDYTNVIIQCPQHLVTRILQQFHRLKSVRNHFNWLMVDLSSSHVPGMLNHLVEGDNLVMMEVSYQNMNLGQAIQLKGLGIEVQVTWCYLNCQSAQNLKQIGPFTDVSTLHQMGQTLLPADFSQLYGQHLNVAFGESRPFVYTKMSGGKKKKVGIEIDMIDALAEHFNFSYTLVDANGIWGVKTNGSWNGMIGLVVSGAADMAISSISITKEREEVVDFLFPHWEDASAVIIKPDTNRWQYFIKNFSIWVWLSVLAVPVVISLILVLITAVSERTAKPKKERHESQIAAPLDNLDMEAQALHQHIHKKRASVNIRRLSIVSNPSKRKRFHSTRSSRRHSISTIASCESHDEDEFPIDDVDPVGSHIDLPEGFVDNNRNDDCESHSDQKSRTFHDGMTFIKPMSYYWYEYFFMLFGSIFYQGIDIPVRSTSSRIVIATFWMTIIIVMGTYMGNLTATLAVRKVHMPFDSLEELASDSKYKLLMREGTYRETIFENTNDSTYRGLWTKIQKEGLVPDKETGFQMVLNMRDYAMVSDKHELLNLVKTSQRCDIRFLKEEFAKSGYGIVVKQGAPYKKLFDKFIMHLIEAGYVEYWNKVHSTKDKCLQKMQEATMDMVTLYDLTLVFGALYGCGLSLASLALLVECLVKFCRNRNKNINK